jgi:hypothetical protein
VCFSIFLLSKILFRLAAFKAEFVLRDQRLSKGFFSFLYFSHFELSLQTHNWIGWEHVFGLEKVIEISD